jgi:hypothetical protein
LGLNGTFASGYNPLQPPQQGAFLNRPPLVGGAPQPQLFPTGLASAQPQLFSQQQPPVNPLLVNNPFLGSSSPQQPKTINTLPQNVFQVR